MIFYGVFELIPNGIFEKALQGGCETAFVRILSDTRATQQGSKTSEQDSYTADNNRSAKQDIRP
eukprot:5204464-Amphidinium_carterae.1